MKKQLNHLVTLALLLFVTFNAQADGTVESVNAIFNPATASEHCNRAILGQQAEQIVAFEADGKVHIRLDIIRKNNVIDGLEMFVMHKAFVPYFSFDKTPVLYEDGPQLIHNLTLDSYLPRIARQKGFVLHGYTIPYVRVMNEIVDTPNNLYVAQTLESAENSQPNDNEISLIRTAELTVDKTEITLRVTREYDKMDPAVPEYYKKTASWTKDINCKMQIM